MAPVSPDMAILQLSSGPLQGRLRSYGLGAFRITLLESNQSLFLSGTRRPKPCTIAIDLAEPPQTHGYQAQGIQLPWPALIGYNFHLRDFDLKIPAEAKLVTLLIAKEHLIERHRAFTSRCLANKHWETTNLLELRGEKRSILLDYLRAIIDSDGATITPSSGNELIGHLLACFDAERVNSASANKREVRHQAAIELLHWYTKNTSQNITVGRLSEVLYQSRTSLFKGCQEHFGQSPQDLQRSIRLDLVRQLLLNPDRASALGLKGIGAMAAYLGFTSRSHFARRYEEHYQELPIDTLKHQHNSDT